MVRVDQIASQLEELNLPAKIFVIMKQESEWQSYIEKICSIYGFYQRDNYEILSFKQEGVLIGDFNDFEVYCKRKWSLEVAQGSEAETQAAVEVNKKIKLHENDEKVTSELEKLLLQKKATQTHKIKPFEKFIHLSGKILQFKFSDKVLHKQTFGPDKGNERKLHFSDEQMQSKEAKTEKKKAKGESKEPRKSMGIDFNRNDEILTKLNQKEKNEDKRGLWASKLANSKMLHKVIDMAYLDKLKESCSAGEKRR